MFRKWAGFSYVPIRWQGFAVLAAMMAVVLPFGAIFLAYADSKPLLGWGAALVSAAAAFAGHAIVVWKLERHYR